MRSDTGERSEMVEERLPPVEERDGRVAVVRDVPVLVCDACGEETREVVVERYVPDYDPSGNPSARQGAQAA